jgi:hypothetical protein
MAGRVEGPHGGPMQLRVRLLSLAACLVLATASVALAEDAPVPDDPVTAAAFATVATGSIGFDLAIVVGGSGMTVELGATGAVELGVDGRGWTILDLSAAGLPPVETIVDGRFVYIRGGYWDEGLEVGAWYGVDLDSTDPEADVFRDELSDTDDAPLILYWLLGGTEEPNYLGAEPLGEVTVDHFAVPIDLAAAVRVVPGELRQLLKDNIYEFRTRGFEPLFDTHVWIDEAGLVRRADYSFVYRPADVEEFRFTWDFYDFGEPVELLIPDPADVYLVGDSVVPEPDPARSA